MKRPLVKPGFLLPRRENPIMAKTTPWHSTRPDDKKVHHDETRCTEGNNIEARYKKSGTGGYPKCNRCKEISG